MANRFTAGAYQIQNTVSGKVYIGSSKNIEGRFRQHKTKLRSGKHQNKHLQSAWLKYGEQAFTFEVLLFCLPEHMRDYEQRLINGLCPAYNQTTSAFAGIPLGAKLTAEHKAKVGSSAKKLWESSKYRAKVTEAINSAMTLSEKQLRSERTKKLWADPAYRVRAVQSRKGKASNKGYRCTPEQVANRCKAARISNIKRNYGDRWKEEYTIRYPMHLGDLHGK